MLGRLVPSALKVAPRIGGSRFFSSASGNNTAPPTPPDREVEGVRHRVTLIPGDGIGPEIAEAVKDVFSAAQ